MKNKRQEAKRNQNLQSFYKFMITQFKKNKLEAASHRMSEYKILPVVEYEYYN